MSAIKSYGRPARQSSSRAKAIDHPTHSALATALARTVAHANSGHQARANDAAYHLVRILKANGIEPQRLSVGP